MRSELKQAIKDKAPPQAITLYRFLMHLRMLRPKTPSEALFRLLLTAGKGVDAARLIPEIRWDWYDYRGHVAAVYSTHFAAQLHTMDWEKLSEDTPDWKTNHLIRPVLEHGNFNYEESVMRLKHVVKGVYPKSEDVFAEYNFEDFVRVFFRGSDLIDVILSETADSPSPVDEEDISVETWINAYYAYFHLMHLTYHAGRGKRVGMLHKPMENASRRLLKHMPKPSAKLKASLQEAGIENLEEVKLLSQDWTANIGHQGHLNVNLMMREMGWWPDNRKPALITYAGRIANRPFLDLLEKRCPLFILGDTLSSPLWHELASLMPFLSGAWHSCALPTGESMYWNDAGSRALAAWDAENRGYPMRDAWDERMRTDDATATLYDAFRRKHGMTETDWYVCLHMRDSGHRGGTSDSGEAIRNTAMDSYLEAVRLVTAAGGWVIRMGGPKTPKFPRMERVIDYAHCDDVRSPEMDIHLVRHARMFIGTTSGFAYVASAMGTPSAMVNSISSLGLLWSKNTRFTLKPIYTSDGRMLSLSEMTSDKYRWAYPTHEALERAGLTVRENSPDEIAEAVREVLDLAAGRVRDDDFDDAWRDHVMTKDFFASSRPSKYFLNKYPVLLAG
jgi:putative glycosyltransferase (TIGR04372 family)